MKTTREMKIMLTGRDKTPAQKILLHGLIVFLIAAAFRFGYVNSMVIDTYDRSDAELYIQLANNLTFNGAYSLAKSTPFSPVNHITPGYPLFLSLVLKIFPPDLFQPAVLNLQALLSTLTAVLFYAMAVSAMPSGAALAIGLLIAISPHLIIGCGYILTETVFTFFLSLTLYLCSLAHRNNRLVLFAVSGVLFGLSALIRPAVLLYPFLLPLIMWKLFPPRRTAIAGLLLILGTSLPWSGWSVWQRNHPAAAGVNMAASSFALGIYPNLTYLDPEQRGFPYREDPEYTAMTKDLGSAAGELLSRARAEPGRYLSWYLLGKPMMYWSPSVIAGAGGPYIYPVALSIMDWNSLPALTLKLMMTGHGIFVVLALLNCIFTLVNYFRVRYISGDSIQTYMFSLFLWYFTAIHTILAPLPRYAFPAYPLVFWLAVHLFTRIIRFLGKSRPGVQN